LGAGEIWQRRSPSPGPQKDVRRFQLNHSFVEIPNQKDVNKRMKPRNTKNNANEKNKKSSY